ncbi:MAG: alpha/beta hydrolase, partial [Thermomicrobiales bacterium]
AQTVQHPARPRLAFDCGTADPLLAENRAFHRHLGRIGYPHHYAEHPGGHTWAYWDEHVRDALRQHLDVLAP